MSLFTPSRYAASPAPRKARREAKREARRAAAREWVRDTLAANVALGNLERADR